MPSGFSAVLELIMAFMGENLLNIVALVIIALFIYWFTVSRPKELDSQQETIRQIRKDSDKSVRSLQELYDLAIEGYRLEHREDMESINAATKIGTSRREEVQYETIVKLREDNAKLVNDFMKATNKFREVMGEVGALYDASVSRANDTIGKNTEFLYTMSKDRELHEQLIQTQLKLMDKQIEKMQETLVRILRICEKLESEKNVSG